VTDRLFVAAWPDADSTETLHRLVDDVGSDAGLVPPESWHVTLRFLGDVDTDAITRRLESVVLPATIAQLGPEVVVLGRHLVVPVSGVDELAAAVRAATVDVGTPADHQFVGHLTLGSVRHRNDLHGRRIDRSFPVDEVHLVRSEPGRRYETVTTLATTAS
jgi:2'-5' RNA ligase